jgi:hypothetical protein
VTLPCIACKLAITGPVYLPFGAVMPAPLILAGPGQRLSLGPAHARSSHGWSHAPGLTLIDAGRIEHGHRAGPDDRPGCRNESGTVVRRLSNETKAAFKTTEFFAYVVVSVGILLASFC